ERLMGYADYRALAVVQRDERRPVQLPKDEAAGAVDRVDDPRVRRRPGLLAVLLAMDAVVRMHTLDFRADHIFRGAVGDGHRVIAQLVALVLHVDDLAEVRQDGFARGKRRPGGEFG